MSRAMRAIPLKDDGFYALLAPHTLLGRRDVGRVGVSIVFGSGCG
jgi:hypothetical protein